jgi:hypothetical protein
MADEFNPAAEAEQATRQARELGEQATQRTREFSEQAAQQTREFTEQAAQQTREFTEQAAQQTRELTAQAIDSGRAFGRMALDTYEQAVNTFVEYERKAADAAPVEWVKTAVGAHASFVHDVNAAYVRAARSVLD